MHHRKDVVSKAGRVGVVLLDAQVAFVVKQTIEHVGRVAHPHVDHLGAEGRVLVGDVGVKRTPGFGAVLRIDVTGALGPPAHLEALAVGRGGRPVAPSCGEGMAELCVDQFRQRGRVRFVTDVPRLQPRELGVGQPGAALRHLGQSQVDRVGQDRCEQQRLVFGCRAGLQVGEVPGEVCPLIYLQEQFGDLDAREQGGCLVDQRLRRLGHGRVQGSDLQAALGDDCLRQIVGRC